MPRRQQPHPFRARPLVWAKPRDSGPKAAPGAEPEFIRRALTAGRRHRREANSGGKADNRAAHDFCKAVQSMSMLANKPLANVVQCIIHALPFPGTVRNFVSARLKFSRFHTRTSPSTSMPLDTRGADLSYQQRHRKSAWSGLALSGLLC